ncbi:hypothetical protein [Nostoc sp. CCY0012]|uniref:hypothetical protein n=1 Tax=Nostoc sp. CCY0012 TaxID=1056123 RepID=UPI0039C69045
MAKSLSATGDLSLLFAMSDRAKRTTSHLATPLSSMTPTMIMENSGWRWHH